MSAEARPQPQQELGRAYTRQRRWIAELQFAVLFVGILVYSLVGLHKWSAKLAQGLTTNFHLQLFFCWTTLWTAYFIASLPVSLYRFFIDRKFEMANSSALRWLWDFFKGHLLFLAFNAVIIETTFFCNILAPSYGWLPAGAFCGLAYVGLSSGLPWLLSFFYPVLPLNNKPLLDRLLRLSAKAGLSVGPILEWRISARTRAANALVAGVGASRRILLTDTLLSTLSEDEVEAIVAHELGHCALHHTAKRLFLQSLIFIAVQAGISFALSHDLLAFVEENRGWRDLTLLPGFFLYWSLGGIYGRILLSSFARKNERDADLYSWQLVGRAEPFITAMRKLTDLNLIVFDKNAAWKYMHPPTADRIVSAEQFAKAQGEPIGTETASGVAESGAD